MGGDRPMEGGEKKGDRERSKEEYRQTGERTTKAMNEEERKREARERKREAKERKKWYDKRQEYSGKNKGDAKVEEEQQEGRSDSEQDSGETQDQNDEGQGEQFDRNDSEQEQDQEQEGQEERYSAEELEEYVRSLRGAMDEYGKLKYRDKTVQAAVDAMRKGEDFDIDDYEYEQKLNDYAELLRNMEYRGRRKYSEATIQRAVEAKRNGEDFDLDDYEAIQISIAREQYEQKRQRKIESILAGRTPEVAVLEMTRNLNHLEEEINRMSSSVYIGSGKDSDRDKEMRRYYRDQYQTAMDEYGLMMHWRELVLGAVPPEVRAAISYKMNEESPVSGEHGNEGEANTHTRRLVEIAAIDTTMSALGNSEEDRQLREALERKKQALMGNDADGEADGGDDSGNSDVEGDSSDSGGDEVEDDYEQRMSEYANEVSEGRLMSDEEKKEMEEQKEHDKLIRMVREKLKVRGTMGKLLHGALLSRRMKSMSNEELRVYVDSL